jgi:purine catabolism regulator
MLPTVRQVLDLPVVSDGGPVVVAGSSGLDRAVRWVHVSELADIASLLRGGELILTTGIALPDRATGQRAYVEELSLAGAHGVVVELGRRWSRLPQALVDAADAHALPLVALSSPVQFVAVTEAVHARIINAQYELLRQSEAAHRAFTTLSVEGSSVADIVTRAAQLSGHALVLEELAHRAVASASGPTSTEELLADWEQRSRADLARPPEERHWVSVPVGPRSHRWATLVAPNGRPDDLHLATILERATEALALHRLLEQDVVSLEQQAHRGVLTDLLDDLAEGRTSDGPAAAARVRALGLPVEDRIFLGAAVWSPSPVALDALALERRDRSLAETVTRATRRAGLSALVATIDSGQVLVLASIPARPAADLTRVTRRLAAMVDEQLRSVGWPVPHTVGVGDPVGSIERAARSLVLAVHVAQVAAALPGPRRAYYLSADLRIRGLLSVLGDEPRLASFVESELGRLREHDRRHGSDLTGLLHAFLRARGNKSELARTSHLSRPALYGRLARIEEVLAVDLEDAESNVSLHVALLVDELKHHRPPR